MNCQAKRNQHEMILNFSAYPQSVLTNQAQSEAGQSLA